jgi:hypothetical protein
MPRNHWELFGRIADDNHVRLVMRAGKEAAVPWIEEWNLAGKPGCFVSKVDPEHGILYAKTPAERKIVFGNGCYVLEPAKHSPGLSKPGGVVPAYVAVRYDEHGNVIDQLDKPYSRLHTPWARAQAGLPLENLIIDKVTKGPFTSDYDVGAAIDTLDPRTGKTFLSVVKEGEKNRSNYWTTGIRCLLNQGLFAISSYNPESERNEHGQERVLHGFEAQFNCFGSPTNRDRETILVVHDPDKVEKINCGTMLEARQVLSELIRESTPPSQGVAPEGGKVLHLADGSTHSVPPEGGSEKT